VWICRNCQKKLGIKEVYSIGNFIERPCGECGEVAAAEDIDKVPPDQLRLRTLLTGGKLTCAGGAVLSRNRGMDVFATYTLGWPKRPTVAQWRETKAEVERLLGYPVTDWGASGRPDGSFWTQVGDARTTRSGVPPMEEVLGE
jgi:hypothetical protein